MLVTLLNHSALVILVLLSVAEAAAGRLDLSKADRDETTLDLASIAFPLASRPAVFALVLGGAEALVPEWQDRFSHWSWAAWIPVYLIGEDMVQYWWHRLGHTKYTWLWRRAIIRHLTNWHKKMIARHPLRSRRQTACTTPSHDGCHFSNETSGVGCRRQLVATSPIMFSRLLKHEPTKACPNSSALK
ncbi:hypothetical protein [Methylocystis iwaonis]|uniref:hypothetical protein n=1 Tax=Methylocystis iwaonis TaxID=2885079 RepID=UPI002E7BE35F|nr:hypothetical protein [Methylocystis iwaonis]